MGSDWLLNRNQVASVDTLRQEEPPLGAGVGVTACLPSHLGFPEPWVGPSTGIGPRPGSACGDPSFLARFTPALRSCLHVRLVQNCQVPGFQHPLHSPRSGPASQAAAPPSFAC